MKLKILILFALLAISAITSATAVDAEDWLLANVESDGSYSPWFSGYSSMALLGLKNSEKNKTTIINYLQTELDNFESLATWGEADSAGLAIYALAINEVQIENKEEIANELKNFQNSATGGFNGFWEQHNNSWVQVSDSVSTSFAMLGLESISLLDNQTKENSTSFLLSLQNLDGSFNLTNVTIYNPLVSLGPSEISTTALSLIALHSISYNGSQATPALEFLKNKTNSTNVQNKTYDLAIAAWALALYGENQSAGNALNLLEKNQKTDGGFTDIIRSSNESNAIDTGIAAFALNEFNYTRANVSTLNNESNTSNSSSGDQGNYGGGSSGKTIRVIVDFSNSSTIDKYAQNCNTAYECFISAGVNLSCQFYSGIGLSCGNVQQVCFVQGVNGVFGNYGFDKSFWKLIYNGVDAAVGVSCLYVNNGDSIELELQREQTPQENEAVTTSSAAALGASQSSGGSIQNRRNQRETVNETRSVEIPANQQATVTTNSEANETTSGEQTEQIDASPLTGFFAFPKIDVNEFLKGISNVIAVIIGQVGILLKLLGL